MRVVYGAGAVAAVSVMAVGLFKPDFGATADQLVNQEDASSTDVQALGESAGTEEARDGARRDRDRSTRRVVRYVYLSPGERAPRGAEVISTDEAARRLGAEPETRPNASRSNDTRQPNRPSQPAANSNRSADRGGSDAQNNQPAPNPRPPAPPVTTRQSGG
ncbi:MAG TPA: hypothetical protein VEX62_05165 [Candidatus Limnocylindrales bacterium]|jgi:hypothetical protein|nr:hypothetical protein [Candidatus Limnocylindrales bacterium]